MSCIGFDAGCHSRNTKRRRGCQAEPVVDPRLGRYALASTGLAPALRPSAYGSAGASRS